MADNVIGLVRRCGAATINGYGALTMVTMVSNENSVRDGHATSEPETTQELLPRHPLSRLAGELTPIERAGLIVELSGTTTAVEVDVLDGRVIYDWHRYEVAMELAKTVVYNRIDDDDPAGYLIGRLVGGRSLNGSQCAAIEVTLRSWQPTGRPAEKGCKKCRFDWETAKDDHEGHGRRGPSLRDLHPFGQAGLPERWGRRDTEGDRGGSIAERGGHHTLGEQTEE